MHLPASHPRRFWPLAALLLLLFLLGAAIAYWSASADGLRLGPNQRNHSQEIWQLHDGTSAGQIFQVDPSQLRALQLWIEPPGGNGAGIVALRLYDLEAKRDIATAQMSVANLASSGSTEFTLEPLGAPVASHITTVELTITTQGVAEANQLRLLGAPNVYSNSIFIRSGRQSPRYDLAFVALYPGRWIDQSIPVTRLASDRPGIFGWPPLYTLSLWLVVYSTLLLVLGVARGQPAGHRSL